MSNTPYEDTRRRHAADLLRRIDEMTARVEWGEDRLERHRDERFARLIAHARAGSPWHAARLGGLPEHPVLGDLERIQPMSKSDVMDNWDAIVTDRRLDLASVERHLVSITADAYLLDRYHATTTGGSSGLRGTFLHDWESWMLSFASGVRWSIRHRRRGGAPSARGPSALVGATHPAHMSMASAATFAPRGSRAHRFPMNVPMDQIVAGLNEIRPAELSGYASVFPILAAEARAGRLRIAPRRMFSFSEPMFPQMRAAVEDAWPEATLFNLYATAECGPIAVSCGMGSGLHLNADLVVVEPLDAAGRPAAEGEVAERILVTALEGTALPLIRYEIPDCVQTLPSGCGCGSMWPKIAEVGGRVDDRFAYGDALLHWYVFTSVIYLEPNIVEYQVRQTEWGAEVHVRTSGPLDVASFTARLADSMSRSGLSDPQVSVRLVDRIERTTMGKLPRFVPLAGRERVERVDGVLGR